MKTTTQAGCKKIKFITVMNRPSINNLFLSTNSSKNSKDRKILRQETMVPSSLRIQTIKEILKIFIKPENFQVKRFCRKEEKARKQKVRNGQCLEL